MHRVFALLCFVVVIHWLIFPYPSGLLHWHCGNLTIAPVPAKQPWWIWINTSFDFIMNDYITTTKQSTTKPCSYFLGYTVATDSKRIWIAYVLLPYRIILLILCLITWGRLGLSVEYNMHSRLWLRVSSSDYVFISNRFSSYFSIITNMTFTYNHG